MSDYFYDYEYDTTYCYPEASVLKNKLNIKDADSLLEAERSITALRILELKQSFPDGKLDFSYFKHQKLYAICRRTYGNETKAETDNPHLPMLNANWGCPKQERQPKEVKIRLWR